jgi:hypothetical protein
MVNHYAKKIILSDWHLFVPNAMNLYVEPILLLWIKSTIQITLHAVTVRQFLAQRTHITKTIQKFTVIFTIRLGLLFYAQVVIWQFLNSTLRLKKMKKWITGIRSVIWYKRYIMQKSIRRGFFCFLIWNHLVLECQSSLPCTKRRRTFIYWRQVYNCHLILVK